MVRPRVAPLSGHRTGRSLDPTAGQGSLPVEEINVESIDEIDSVYWFDDVQRPTVRAVIDHARLIDEVDIGYPVIIGPHHRVMDGMHRIARALRDGRPRIAARRLPELPPPDFRSVHPDELPYERS